MHSAHKCLRSPLQTAWIFTPTATFVCEKRHWQGYNSSTGITQGNPVWPLERKLLSKYWLYSFMSWYSEEHRNEPVENICLSFFLQTQNNKIMSMSGGRDITAKRVSTMPAARRTRGPFAPECRSKQRPWLQDLPCCRHIVLRWDTGWGEEREGQKEEEGICVSHMDLPQGSLGNYRAAWQFH